MDRLGMLRKMAAAKPDDPFPAYGLAMELAKQGELEEARDLYRKAWKMAEASDHPNTGFYQQNHERVVSKLEDESSD